MRACQAAATEWNCLSAQSNLQNRDEIKRSEGGENGGNANERQTGVGPRTCHSAAGCAAW